MRPLTRREHIAIAVCLIVAVVVANTVYDLLVTRAVKEYMLRIALHQAGRGPLVEMRDIVAPLTYEAVWISLLYGSSIALAGLLTVRMLGAGRRR